MKMGDKLIVQLLKVARSFWEVFLTLLPILVLSLVWANIVHEPAHILSCLFVQKGTPTITWGVTQIEVVCTPRAADVLEAIRLLAPYFVDMLVLFALFFVNLRCKLAKLISVAPFVDTFSQFVGAFFGPSDFSVVIYHLPGFYPFAVFFLVFNTALFVIRSGRKDSWITDTFSHLKVTPKRVK
jgi:hypothetical protein